MHQSHDNSKTQKHSDDEISLKGEKYKAKNIRPPISPTLINICYE